jgi:putative transposase
MAESFVDSYKTELIADRVWKTRSQLELATVEWVAWFNNERLHESLGDIPPVEFEQLHGARTQPISDNGSVAALSPSGADRLTTRPRAPVGTEIAVDGPLDPDHATQVRAVLAKTAPKAVVARALPAGLSDE